MNDTARVLVTIPEACEMLSLSRATVERLRRSGFLEARKIGHATRITVRSIEALADFDVTVTEYRT